jgi:diacylglycerol O-acyltransferase
LPLPSPKLPAVAPVGRLPAGRIVDLPGRGRTYVVDSGPAEGPTFILLHGVACTGLLTWYSSLELMRGFGRVVVFDQRGHGAGINPPRFRLHDCADDVVALADALGIDTFIPVGFSMGSLVAQLVWHRHRDRVDALVLCAAAAAFGRGAHQRLLAGTLASLLTAFAGQPGAASAAPPHESNDEVCHSRLWALGQFRSTDSRAILRALAEIIRFDSRAWLADIDVPTAVVIPRHDQLISPRHQHWLARQIPTAHTVTVDAGHACFTLQSNAFLRALRSAVKSVLDRMPASAAETFGPPHELVG